MADTITLTKVYNPLNRADQDTVQWSYLPGSTVADLLDATGTVINQREGHQMVVSVNGQIVPAAEYTETSLVPGQCVTLVPVLSGGSTDSKNVLRTVGLVVLAVIATVVSVFFPALWPVTGFLWKAAFMSAIMTVGMAIYGAFAGGGPAANPSLNGYQGADQSNSYSWNPVTTQQQGIVIPWYYGQCKVSGNIIGVYRESSGNKQYLNAMICLGNGILSGVTDIMLNDQPLSNYTGIDLHTRLGYLDQPTIPNFGDTVTEYAQGTKINYGTPVMYSTVGSDFDALEVEVGFPNGLYYYDDYGNLKPLSVNFSISIRKAGVGAWTVISKQPGTTKVSLGGYWSAGQWYTEPYHEYGSGGGSVWSEYANGGSDPNSYYEGQNYNGWGTWRWIGEPIQIIDIVLDYVTSTAAQSGAIRYNYRANGLEPGQYEIQITRLTGDYVDTRYGDDFYLLAVREVLLDDFTYPGTALVGLRALATDQLSGSFSFTCKTPGKLCRVYNGSVWSVAATSNPAWVCFDVLTQPVFDNSLNVVEYRAHAPENLDLARWLEWAEYCDDLVPDGNGGTEPRLTFNGGFDSAQSMWDVALTVAGRGRATPYWRGQTITIAIDKPASPVALISVGNIGLDSFEETFLPMDDRAGSIEADFLNIEKGLDRDKFTVINPDAPPEWGAASLPMQGVIKPSEVWRHCRYHLATTQNLIRIVTVQMDIDSIAFTLGDVINVQHDVPMWGEGGRIVAATSTTLTLDKQVIIETGKTYSVMLRLLDGSIVERAVVTAPATTDILTVSTPFTDLPDTYDVYAFGEVETSIKPMRVVGIDPAGDLKRKITLTDYNESIYNADLLLPVVPTVNYSPDTFPVITGLKLSERLVKDISGTITTMLDISWDFNASTNAKSIELLLNGSSSALVDYGKTTASVPVVDGTAYTVQARYISWLNIKQSLDQVATGNITILGKTAPPANVLNLRASATSYGGLILSWDAVADVDLLNYSVRFSNNPASAWENALDMGTAFSTTLTIPAALDGIYLVKAIDTGLRESLVAASVITTIPSLANYNAIAVADDGATWPGGKTSCYELADKLYLDMAGLVDDLTDWDACANIDTYGGARPEGYYAMAEQVDLGTVQTSRCAVQVDYAAVDTSSLFDSVQDFDAVANFDGSVVPGVSVQPQIRTSMDGSNWGEWMPFVAGDYTAMSLQFRLKLATTIPTNVPQVSSFAVAVDMPDRAERGQGVAIDASGTYIGFATPYMVPPIVRTTIIGATSGDTEKITNITTSGFTMQILNAGSGVARTIDWQSVGY
jgi:predicted phage tail protein/sulfur carrier protein ThiS